MSDKKEAAQDTESPHVDNKSKSAQGVVDYLQAPRKKRKNFVVVAVGQNGDQDAANAIVRFVKQAYPKYAVSTPQTAEEFVRQFSRNIILTVISDDFMDLDGTLDLVKLMKERKNESAIPVLFLTKNPDTLIHAYSKKLAAWHEVDEYIVPALTPRQYLFSKVKAGIEERYRRRSRRYKINFPITFTVLNEGDRKFKGTVIDLSVHGAQIQVHDGYIFTPRDQLIVHLPYGNYVKDAETDILRVAGKVKRIYISGDRAGISWEHLSDSKIENVSRMLTYIVDSSLARQAATTRARIAKAEAEAAAANHRGGPPE